jgi:hypothetical protein
LIAQILELFNNRVLSTDVWRAREARDIMAFSTVKPSSKALNRARHMKQSDSNQARW